MADKVRFAAVFDPDILDMLDRLRAPMRLNRTQQVVQLILAAHAQLTEAQQAETPKPTSGPREVVYKGVADRKRAQRDHDVYHKREMACGFYLGNTPTGPTVCVTGPKIWWEGKLSAMEHHDDHQDGWSRTEAMAWAAEHPFESVVGGDWLPGQEPSRAPATPANVIRVDMDYISRKQTILDCGYDEKLKQNVMDFDDWMDLTREQKNEQADAWLEAHP